MGMVNLVTNLLLDRIGEIRSRLLSLIQGGDGPEHEPRSGIRLLLHRPPRQIPLIVVDLPRRRPLRRRLHRLGAALIAGDEGDRRRSLGHRRRHGNSGGGRGHGRPPRRPGEGGGRGVVPAQHRLGRGSHGASSHRIRARSQNPNPRERSSGERGRR